MYSLQTKSGTAWVIPQYCEAETHNFIQLMFQGHIHSGFVRHYANQNRIKSVSTSAKVWKRFKCSPLWCLWCDRDKKNKEFKDFFFFLNKAAAGLYRKTHMFCPLKAVFSNNRTQEANYRHIFICIWIKIHIHIVHYLGGAGKLLCQLQNGSKPF